MKPYLLNLWDTVRTSYWFVPGLFAVAAVVCGIMLPWLDALLIESEVWMPEWVRTKTDAARTTLSAIAGAMVAVTGTVFSITIVTLSLTSQQFGPRLLRRFMHDVPTQLTLGVFLSTGFYCLLVLRVVERHEEVATVPHLSVLAAVLLAVLSMAMLIVFIHHVAMLIQAPHVVASVADELDDAIDRLFPERIGESAEDEKQADAAGREQESRLGENSFVVYSTHEGYVQAIDGRGLMHLAREHDLVIRLCSRPGKFIARGSLLAEVWTRGRDASEEWDADELTGPVNEKVISGIRRTPRQDVECAIEEIVEVAVRSLSPGINDPFTAMTCIDCLGASLGRLAERKMPSAYRAGDDGQLRLIANPDSFPGALDAAFDQIRQYGRSSVAVTIRLLEALTMIAKRAQRRGDLDEIRRQAEMVARHAESLPEENDRQEIRRRFEEIKTK